MSKNEKMMVDEADEWDRESNRDQFSTDSGSLNYIRSRVFDWLQMFLNFVVNVIKIAICHMKVFVEAWWKTFQVSKLEHIFV